KKSVRKGCSTGSGSSSNSSRRLVQYWVKCNCGTMLIVKNGPNVGSKFYGCPLWPDTKCEMFNLNDGINDVEDLEVQLLEKNTAVAERQVVKKLKDDKTKKLQKKKGSLEEELNGWKCEMNKMKVDMLKEKTIKANLHLALVIVCAFS
ncbi:Kinesin-like protein KIN-14N, partial [Bienertia sinuspersici]